MDFLFVAFFAFPTYFLFFKLLFSTPITIYILLNPLFFDYAELTSLMTSVSIFSSIFFLFQLTPQPLQLFLQLQLLPPQHQIRPVRGRFIQKI